MKVDVYEDIANIKHLDLLINIRSKIKKHNQQRIVVYVSVNCDQILNEYYGLLTNNRKFFRRFVFKFMDLHTISVNQFCKMLNNYPLLQNDKIFISQYMFDISAHYVKNKNSDFFGNNKYFLSFPIFQDQGFLKYLISNDQNVLRFLRGKIQNFDNNRVLDQLIIESDLISFYLNRDKQLANNKISSYNHFR
jgi:hypothetical protein